MRIMKKAGSCVTVLLASALGGMVGAQIGKGQKSECMHGVKVSGSLAIVDEQGKTRIALDPDRGIQMFGADGEVYLTVNECDEDGYKWSQLALGRGSGGEMVEMGVLRAIPEVRLSVMRGQPRVYMQTLEERLEIDMLGVRRVELKK